MSASAATLSVMQDLTHVFVAPDTLAAVSRLSDGRIVAVSPGFELIFGLPATEIVGKTAVEVGLWRDNDQRAGILTLLKQRGSTTGEPVSMRTRAGDDYDGLMSCALIDHGGERYIFALIQDVRSYNTELQARSREFESFRTLIMESEVGVYRRRAPPHGLIDVNPALAQMLGCSSTDALIVACATQPHFDYVDTAHAARIQAQLREQGRIAHVRAQIRRVDGGTVWVSESARAVFGASGELLHIDGTLIDITVQVRAEQALIQSESLYRNLVENSRDGVFLMQHGRILFANDALGAILGYRAEDLIGASYFDWVAPEDLAAQAQRKSSREAGSQETQEYEIRLLRRGGTKRLCAVRAGAVQFRGEPASIGTLRDVTEARAQQRRLEAAEERYRLLFKHAVLGMFQSTLDGELIEVSGIL